MNTNIFIGSCESTLYILFSSGCSIVPISCGNTLHALNNPATVWIFAFDDNNELLQNGSFNFYVMSKEV